jgi:hypothetical protein
VTSKAGSESVKLTNSSRALPLWLTIGKIEEKAACNPWFLRCPVARWPAGKQ